MPKQKKTRKQKLKTDERRQMPSSLGKTPKSVERVSSTKSEPVQEQGQSTYSLSESFSAKSTPSTITQSSTKETKIDTNEYKYLRGDLLKTTFLTSAIVVAEIVIRFAFERR